MFMAFKPAEAVKEKDPKQKQYTPPKKIHFKTKKVRLRKGTLRKEGDSRGRHNKRVSRGVG